MSDEKKVLIDKGDGGTERACRAPHKSRRATKSTERTRHYDRIGGNAI